MLLDAILSSMTSDCPLSIADLIKDADMALGLSCAPALPQTSPPDIILVFSGAVDARALDEEVWTFNSVQCRTQVFRTLAATATLYKLALRVLDMWVNLLR